MKYKIIKKLAGHSSEVALVEKDGQQYVFKTAKLEDIFSERQFFVELHKHGIPSLEVFEDESLESNQILLEYVRQVFPFEELCSIQNCRKWGEVVKKMHNIHYPNSFRIGLDGERINLDWGEFMKSQIDFGLQLHKERQFDISDKRLTQIQEFLDPLISLQPKTYSLIHGDMHAGNFLIRNGEVILFDKSEEIFSGDLLLDLAVTMLEFPNGTYATIDDPEYTLDRDRLNTFVEGYGRNFLESNRELLDRYVLLRAWQRFQSKFNPYNKLVVEGILVKYFGG